MGDRIVVMKDGFIQQVDTPQNLYDLPVNEFVAGFKFGRKLYTDLMNGVSHMIPFITGGGILIALSYFLDRGNAGAEMFGRGTSLAMLVRTIGNTSFNLMYVVLAGFIAMSVGDLPALVAGMAGGMLAIQEPRWHRRRNGCPPAFGAL